ncbi:RNA-guided endonuclease TnpB family protein (plasmid) [Klebsiella pneumoniae]
MLDCRMDNLHKLSRKLINENQVVCVESLKVKNMIRNPKLSQHIADASSASFVRQLQYKTEWAGERLSQLTSFSRPQKRCSGCGYISKSMPLNVRDWVCPECGTNHDRDVNAAIKDQNRRAGGVSLWRVCKSLMPSQVVRFDSAKRESPSFREGSCQYGIYRT